MREAALGIKRRVSTVYLFILRLFFNRYTASRDSLAEEMLANGHYFTKVFPAIFPITNVIKSLMDTNFSFHNG